MAPLVHALAVDDRFDAMVCVFTQHREMLDQEIEVLRLMLRPVGVGSDKCYYRILKGSFRIFWSL